MRTRAFVRGRTEQVAAAASRARRLGQYEEVRRRHAAGQSLLSIKKATGLARATVRRFARAESFPERSVRAPQPSRLDPFLALAGRTTGRGLPERFGALPRTAYPRLYGSEPTAASLGAKPAHRPGQNDACRPTSFTHHRGRRTPCRSPRPDSWAGCCSSHPPGSMRRRKRPWRRWSRTGKSKRRVCWRAASSAW